MNPQRYTYPACAITVRFSSLMRLADYPCLLTSEPITATMMTNVVVADFLRQKILIPTIYEQNKIGKLLAKFDHLLSFREKQLTLLKHKCLKMNGLLLTSTKCQVAQ